MTSHAMHTNDISNIILFQLNNEFFLVPQNTITLSTPKHISLQAISCLNTHTHTCYTNLNEMVHLKLGM